MLRRLIRFFVRGAYSQGGTIPEYRPHPGAQIVALSPGRRIEDPDEAEALGMTATARRLRRQQGA